MGRRPTSRPHCDDYRAVTIAIGFIALRSLDAPMTVERLERYGVEALGEDEIVSFLGAQRYGVLGLGTDDAPYLLPLTYGYGGGTDLYFTYLLGPESRKGRLSRSDAPASFIVFDVESPFVWTSVLLAGPVDRLEEDEWERHRDVLDDAWRPELFERAASEETVEVYRFRADERTGLRQTDLPPGFEG